MSRHELHRQVPSAGQATSALACEGNREGGTDLDNGGRYWRAAYTRRCGLSCQRVTLLPIKTGNELTAIHGGYYESGV